jgi:hypothetical protein
MGIKSRKAQHSRLAANAITNANTLPTYTCITYTCITYRIA